MQLLPLATSMRMMHNLSRGVIVYISHFQINIRLVFYYIVPDYKKGIKQNLTFQNKLKTRNYLQMGNKNRVYQSQCYKPLKHHGLKLIVLNVGKNLVEKFSVKKRLIYNAPLLPSVDIFLYQPSGRGAFRFLRRKGSERGLTTCEDCGIPFLIRVDRYYLICMDISVHIL